jgi:hypothetical protein
LCENPRGDERNAGGLVELVQIAPECPVCRARHDQTFTQEELRERLKKPVVELYCNRFDKTWPATIEDREKLARILSAFQRASETRTAPL